eukprot:11177520-Lingulodinium_polyedra.AAC.1
MSCTSCPAKLRYCALETRATSPLRKLRSRTSRTGRAPARALARAPRNAEAARRAFERAAAQLLNPHRAKTHSNARRAVA